MIDVGFDLCCGWRWHWRLNWLRLCENVIGLVVTSFLVLQPGYGTVFIHFGSK